MNKNSDLQDALSKLAEVLPHDVSRMAEERMLNAFRARPRRLRRKWLYAAAIAACAILAFTWLLTAPSRQRPSPAYDTNQTLTAGFVPLPYAQSDVPLEEAVIVRVQLPRSQLLRLGVPLAPSAAQATVSADLLVGQDGVARAVRLVRRQLTEPRP